MKKLLLTIMLCILAPLTCYASSVSGMGAPAPAQSYHQAGSAPVAAVSAKQKTMAQVEKVMQAAKQYQQSQTTTNNNQTEPAVNQNKRVVPEVVSNVSQSKQANTPSMNQERGSASRAQLRGKSGQAVASQVSEMGQSNLLFQQQTNEKIVELSEQNAQLSSNLQRLRKALVLMNEEVSGLNQHLQSLNGQFHPANVGSESQAGGLLHDMNTNFSIVIACAVLALAALLLLVFLVLPRRRKVLDTMSAPMNAEAATATTTQVGGARTSSDDDRDTDDEYDFMGSDEAIPAKLDLANAYITMEDFAAATQVLEEVVERGNKDQQEKAKELLKQISAL